VLLANILYKVCPKYFRSENCPKSHAPAQSKMDVGPLTSARSCCGFTNTEISGFGGLGVSVLASGTQVRGFKPGRSRRIFKGGNILSTPSFGREVKPWVPCHRSLSVPWKSALRQNSRSLFFAHKFQLPPLECGTRR
jgi:hypothetical protein